MGDEVISAPAVLAAGGAMAAMPASAAMGAAASGGLGYAAADGTVVAERPHFSPLSHAEASVCDISVHNVQQHAQFLAQTWSTPASRVTWRCCSCLRLYTAM